MKISLQKVLNAFLSVRSIEKEKVSNRFAYGISKNRAKMQSDVDGIIASERIIMEEDKKRIDYCIAHAVKDDKGDPIIEIIGKDARYKGVNENDPEIIIFVKKLIELKKAHDELLKTETEIDFYMIPFEDIPNEISINDFENLSIFINELTITKGV